MIKLKSKNYLFTGMTAVAVVVAVTFAVSTQPVRAQDTPTTEVKNQETVQTTTTNQQEAARVQELKTAELQRQQAEQAKVSARREVVQTRLADAKLKVCQLREKNIDNIMSRMGDRGVKQLDVFTKIADRTEAFYVKSGKVLSNYDALVADVTAKKADAQAAVTAAQSTTVTFKCDGTDPKGAVSSFKTSLEAQNQALKAYKTAVKNLIVGVKSVQGTTTSSDVKQTEGSQQ